MTSPNGTNELIEARQPLFTPKTLAAYLALSDRTVRQMLHDRAIPSYKVAGARRIDPADVDRYLEQHRDRWTGAEP